LDRTSSQQRLQQARQQPELLWGCPEKQASETHNAKNRQKVSRAAPKTAALFIYPNFNHQTQGLTEILGQLYAIITPKKRIFDTYTGA
jgi:hypothetical protein